MMRRRASVAALLALLAAPARPAWPLAPATTRDLERVLGAGASEEPAPPATMTPEQRAEDALWRLERGEAELVLAPAGPGGTVRVAGRIQWTDSAGNTHPAPYVRVEVRDDEVITSDLLSSVLTDAEGNYTSLVDNDDGAGQAGRDIFIRAIATSGGTNVDAGLLSSPYYIDSSVRADVADGTELQIDLTANNTDNNNIAFGLLNALVEADFFIRSLTGSFPTPTVVHFPFDGTFYTPGPDYVALSQQRAFDWDSLLHEYGHRFAIQRGIDASPGREHSSHTNLAEGTTKDKGLLGAWGEGFASFFSLWAQSSRGLAARGSATPCIRRPRWARTPST